MSLTIAWLNENQHPQRKQAVDHNVDVLNQQKQFCPLPNMQFIQRKLSLKSKKKITGLVLGLPCIITVNLWNDRHVQIRWKGN